MKRVYWQWRFITAGTPDSQNRNISPKLWTVLKKHRYSPLHLFLCGEFPSCVVKCAFCFITQICVHCAMLLSSSSPSERQGELPVLHTFLISHTFLSKSIFLLRQLQTQQRRSALRPTAAIKPNTDYQTKNHHKKPPQPQIRKQKQQLIRKHK